MTIDPSLVDRFRTLFRGRENCYGQYGAGPKRHVETLRAPVPDAAWLTHLEGTGPFLGIVPITQGNTCYWGAIDIDDEGVDHRALAVAVDALKLPLTVCRSKSGGAHLYLFLIDPAPAKTVHAKLKQWAAALGHAQNHDSRPTEIFPKQTRLKPDEVGNWINLPYYKADDTNRYALELTGEALPLAGFVAAAEARRVAAAELENIYAAGVDPFADGPPCLRTLHTLGYPAGQRNQGLYNVAVFEKLAHPQDWKQRVAEYNESRMDPPLPQRELEGTLASVERRDYTYKCNELPIQPHCHRPLCKKAKFGIGAFRAAKDKGLLPEFTRPQKVLTDPVRWRLELNGKQIELLTDDLLSLQRFRKIAMERTSVLVPLLKQPDWDDIVRELMTECEEIAAPEEAGIRGQFKSLVRAYLALRDGAANEDDLLNGRPVEVDGRVEFKSPALMNYLARQKFFEYDPSKAYSVLQTEMGVTSVTKTIRGARTELWSVPVPTEHETIEELAVPAPPAERF